MSDTEAASPRPHTMCVRIEGSDIALVAVVNPRGFSHTVNQILSASLRGRGVLYSDPSLNDSKFGPTELSARVITRGEECIGVFEVTDWKAAVETLRTELEALKVSKFSMIGHFEAEKGVCRTIFPQGSTQDMTPIFQRFNKWATESSGTDTGLPP
jgi:hypothetical protein